MWHPILLVFNNEERSSIYTAIPCCMIGKYFLSVLLSICFPCMFKHSYLPVSILDSVIVPLSKNKNGDLSDKKNYRPTALSSVISKMFENVILYRIEKYPWTTDNQFAFKASHSTDLCVYVLTEFMEYVPKMLYLSII